MKKLTNLRSGSYELTMRSADKNEVVTIGGAVHTATQAVPCPIVEVQIEDDQWPAGYKSIDQVIAESEKEPNRRRALQEARRWAAETFYRNEDSLRSIRLRKGLSQARLAELVGTTQPHVGKVENGLQDVQVGTLLRFAHALEADELDTVRAYLTVRRAVLASQNR